LIVDRRQMGRCDSVDGVELSESSIEAIATRVVELLESRQIRSGLVDAAELARRLGVTRTWVYEHPKELQAIRLGKGPCPRMRFDRIEAEAALKSAQAQPEPPPMAYQRPRRRRPRASSIPLLPVDPPGPIRRARPPRS
jgi:hypothetical protein